ncbi:ABC transporter ATP-binding protein [Agilicoccus flavus]|uniref:ABC transporter ATP-binding protein n=1 Tax=Agilicoccus flavus TaxID=2775968 RepID=UPI001CF60A05|nr:ABC transporter ATP-binding protein [Agilicoccus flavus]
MTSPVVVESLVKGFGGVRAVDGMSWSAPPGAVTAVLGPNGAGKTTTIACLEGLLRPDSGRVRVLGADPWRADAAHRARVGVMLQDAGLVNTSRPVRLLRHLAALYDSPTDVDELVETLGIAAFAGTTIRRLSGGQKQRVALAAALLGRPEVAFLDEPSAGLDPHARLDVWALLRRTREAGATVVVSTHSFEEAERLADHVVIVAGGRAVAEGTPSDIAGEAGLEATYFALTSPEAAR